MSSYSIDLEQDKEGGDDISLDQVKGLTSRKEYASLKIIHPDFRESKEQDEFEGKYLKTHTSQQFVSLYMQEKKRLHLMWAPGCHPAGTKVITADGSIKKVEEITTDDLLLGDDSGIRKVLSLARGVDDMWKIKSLRGWSSFVCNERHILTLYETATGNIIDVPLRKILADSRSAGKVEGYHLIRYSPEFTGKLDIGVIHDISRAIETNSNYSLPDACFRAPRRARLHLCRAIEILSDYIDKPIPLALLADLQQLKKSLCLSNSAIDIHTDISTVPRMTTSEFAVRYVGIDKYYGFTLSGNGRYLLDSYIVTHNSGKTNATLAATSLQIKSYRKAYRSLLLSIGKLTPAARSELEVRTPSVFILGFEGPKKAFMRDLLKYPEYGFISTSEREHLSRLRALADSGIASDVETYKEFYSKLKRRLTNKQYGGFYRFYGYDKFVNRLFISNGVTLAELEAEALRAQKIDQSVTTEKLVKEAIADGRLRVNQRMMTSFENSYIVCDESHKTYNSLMKNNRGVAIQYVIDNVPSVKLLTLSATPLSNSPSEIVEMMNYLCDQKYYKKDLFNNNKDLKPGALEIITKALTGKVSFLQDINEKYFPKSTMVGEKIILPHSVGSLRAGEEVPYLKFIPCPMSKFHQHTLYQYASGPKKKGDDISEYAKGEEVNELEDEDISAFDPESGRIKISSDTYCLYDMVFPNPEDDEVGLYNSSNTFNVLATASQEWQEKVGVTVSQGKIKSISGRWMALGDDENGLGKYSSKYANLVKTLIDLMKSFGGDENKTGKVMIYHHRVRMSGVMTIINILLENGFLDETRAPAGNTLCCLCGRTLNEHINDSLNISIVSHNFTPARVILAHGEIDKRTLDNSLAKFDSVSNARGHNYMFLLGSGVVGESFDFKDIQYMTILTLPEHISALIQVLGRAVRKHSHENLPKNMWNVSFYIFISTVNKAHYHEDEVSPELYRYVYKLLNFITIQKIYKSITAVAPDAYINREIVMSPSIKKQFFPSSSGPVDSLAGMYFDLDGQAAEYNPMIENEKLTSFVFNKVIMDELEKVLFMIKRLFIRRAVWQYDELFHAVKNPPFGTENNPSLIEESTFIVALNQLVVDSVPVLSSKDDQSSVDLINTVQKMLNYTDRNIYMGNSKYRIRKVQDFYIRFPVIEVDTNIFNEILIEQTEQTRSKERALIRALSNITPRQIADDMETYTRPPIKQESISVQLSTYKRLSQQSLGFDKNIERLESAARDGNIINFILDFSIKFQIALVSSIIEKANSGKKLSNLENRVLQLMKSFDAVVYGREVILYKNILQRFERTDINEDDPIGYCGQKAISLLDRRADGSLVWFEVSKVSINRHMIYKENSVIIGYLESVADKTKVKLRKPIHEIMRVLSENAQVRKKASSNIGKSAIRRVAADMRIAERGIICETKNKKELINILEKLEISDDLSRVKNICRVISLKLINNEISERQKKGRLAWFYGWWSAMPPITSVG